MYVASSPGGISLTNCSFSGNKAVLAGTTATSPFAYGGAVHLLSSTAGFRRCTFASNSVWGGAASNSSTVNLRGGALYHAGGPWRHRTVRETSIISTSSKDHDHHVIDSSLTIPAPLCNPCSLPWERFVARQLGAVEQHRRAQRQHRLQLQQRTGTVRPLQSVHSSMLAPESRAEPSQVSWCNVKARTLNVPRGPHRPTHG
jgi:hypothetical protein